MKVRIGARFSWRLASVLGLSVSAAQAQVIINDTLTGAASGYDWKALNGACLTAGNNTGTIPACEGLPYYSGKVQVGGVSGRLPDRVGSGALRLTNGDITYDGLNGDFQTGAVVSNFTFATNQGLEVTWTSVTYGGDGLEGSGADGMSFFLSDGAYPPTVGGSGGSLGYSCSNLNNPYDGVIGGYLGVSIDEFGNFANKVDNTSTGDEVRIPSRISVRGAGSVNYSWLNSKYPQFYPASLRASKKKNAVNNTCRFGTLWNFSSVTRTDSKGQPVPSESQSFNDVVKYNYNLLGTPVALAEGVVLANQQAKPGEINTPLRQLATQISYSLKITPDGLLDFVYQLEGGTQNKVITGLKITDSNGPLPQSFRFGFAAGTGGGSNVHEILCFLAAPSNLANSSSGSNVQESGRVGTGSQVYLAYYHPANSWGQLTAQGLLYDPVTDALSIKSVADWDANCVLSGGDCPSTRAVAGVAQKPDERAILTWNGSNGTPLRWSDLTAAQRAELTSGDAVATDARLRFLRGDRTGEVKQGGSFRNRTGVLGDIVHSSPTWVGAPALPYKGPWEDKLNRSRIAPEGTSYSGFAASQATRLSVVYVGAGDGLLHGFRSGSFDRAGAFVGGGINDGREVLAYMPAHVLTAIHSPADDGAYDYSNSRYSHNYFVDATPGTGDLYYNKEWHTWLVGGLGAGGHTGGPINDFQRSVPPRKDPALATTSALYALDVTNPGDFLEGKAAAIVIGEWSSQTLSCVNVPANCGASLGQTYGTPVIRRLHDGNWAVLFGNGSNSSNGTAGLYVMHVDSATGARSFRFLDTGYGSSRDPEARGGLNGIIQVTPADLDGDHVTDYVYAADLFGNLWRFDLTSKEPNNWKAGAAPLFSTPGGQPVSTRVTVSATVTSPTRSTTRKVLVSFGTGRKEPQTLTSAARYAPGSQSLYGIWDWNMAGWNALGSDAKYEFLKEPQTIAVDRLQTQTIQDEGRGAGEVSSYRSVTENIVCWRGSNDCGGANEQFGWKVALPKATEQVIYNPIIGPGNMFIVNTMVPETENVLSCSRTPPAGYTMALNIASGGAPKNSYFPDQHGEFTKYEGRVIAGIGLNGTGSPSVMTTQSKVFLVQQTQKSAAAVTQVNPGAGMGRRLTWSKLR